MKQNLYYMVAVCLMAASCKKYLDVKPDNSIASPTTIMHLQALLDHSGTMNIYRTPNLGDASADDYFLTEETYNSFSEDKRAIYTWTRKEYYFQNDWSVAYQPIYQANYCLDQLVNVSKSIELDKIERIEGAALFFRSYYFLHLMWVYAKAYDEETAHDDPGIVLRLTSDFNVPSVRSSVAECYEQIINDTRYAATLLPDRSEHVFRPDKAAAYGLLARAFLSIRSYDSAFVYADKCLRLKDDLMDFNGDVGVHPDLSSMNVFEQFNKETIFYSDMNITDFISEPYYARVDTILYDSYNEDDLRKVAYFKPNGAYHQFKGNYTGNQYDYFTGIATNEIFLIRAEAATRIGDFASGIADLNTLLRHRWRQGTYKLLNLADQEQALQIILLERRKELQGRGFRWMDIKRLNKEGANLTLRRHILGQIFELSPNASYYALPIPADVISVTGIPQN